MKIKGKKANFMITLSPGTVVKAREHGLNISKVSENALKNVISRLEGLDLSKNRGFGIDGFDWCGRLDLNANLPVKIID